MSQGFNPEQLKRIALAARLERDKKIDTKVDHEELPDPEAVKNLVSDIELQVVAESEQGQLSTMWLAPEYLGNKGIYEVSLRFKEKNPRLMVIISEGERCITISWDGLNHV